MRQDNSRARRTMSPSSAETVLSLVLLRLNSKLRALRCYSFNWELSRGSVRRHFGGNDGNRTRRRARLPSGAILCLSPNVVKMKSFSHCAKLAYQYRFGSESVSEGGMIL